jgi:hypothetical protein
MSTPRGGAVEPSDPLVLAAVQRAGLHHRPQDGPPAPTWAIVAHLALHRHRGPGRRIRSRLQALADAGLLARSERHGAALWRLSAKGARRLARERRSGGALALPESPQHRAWRNARRVATLEVGRFELDLWTLLTTAEAMLQSESPPSSDAWFELAERLRSTTRFYGSALHCLREWPEPSDRAADVDCLSDPGDELLARGELARVRARRRGRRNIALWRGTWTPW